jgi:hypothetical protein
MSASGAATGGTMNAVSGGASTTGGAAAAQAGTGGGAAGGLAGANAAGGASGAATGGTSNGGTANGAGAAGRSNAGSGPFAGAANTTGGAVTGAGGAPAAGAANNGGKGGKASAGANGGGVAGTASGGSGGSGGAGAGCPYSGHVTYTLARAANPSAEQTTAYGLITTAVEKAIVYYNCYTNITKSLNVQYVPSVQTADGNINGSLRFGSDKTYMDYRTAMHEIGHTVGIGQASNWGSFVTAEKIFTGSNALAELQAINAELTTPGDTQVHADNQHFWPYGLNQQSEVHSERDLIFHCRMVMAIRRDLGLS